MESIIVDKEVIGVHNTDIDKSIERVEESKMYEDLSTIIICPTRGMFPTRVIQSWMKLLKPMNQSVAGPIFAECMKVDAGYNALIRYILDNPFLSKFKYVLTIEEDNLPPTDGLLELYKSMDKYDVVGGLYWEKTENGFPMMFGDPKKGPLDPKPQLPIKGTVQHVNALGMGFNLFKLDMFRNIEEPWFKTVNEANREEGTVKQFTQDIYFYRKAAEAGYKFACDTSILVGHYDLSKDIVY